MIPTFIFSSWLFGLLSVGLLSGGILLARAWYQRAWDYDLTLDRYVFDPNWGFNPPTALLVAGLLLLIWVFAGGLILRWLLRATANPDRGGDPPLHTRQGIAHRLRRPDGSELQVEVYGPADGPPLVLTHGWGMNSTEWYYLKQQLSNHFQLIVWDLPGLGLSTRPANNDYSLENLARDLEAVLELAGGRPALLLGHSIGGMITLTFCRLFPQALRTRVAGLVLVHTTYTNPVRTTSHARLFTALERPLLVPLLHLTIWLSPLVWLMNWFSYLNGSAHLSTKRSGFAGGETWAQVEFATSFQPHASPAVLARGMLGMLAYDATQTLPMIGVPTLVVPGDRDPVCRPEASVRIDQDVPSAQLAPLAPAKHMGLIEQHERFVTLVRDFAHTCFHALPALRIGEYMGSSQREASSVAEKRI
jgi:pimeloyl-ACP methyl ester carboxylesterase